MLHPFLDYTLEGFRCFRNRTEFREPRHVNIICGANNSGKSTLLLPLRRVTAPHNLPEVPPFRDDILVADRNMLEQLRFQVEDISHGCGQFRVIFHQAVGCDYFIEGSKNFGTPLMEFGCPGEPPDKLTDAKKAEMRAAIEEHGRLIQYIPA